MVEAMVASVVGVVGILGVLALLTNSMAKSREVSERFIATFLASEGIEIVRGLVDENYTNGTDPHTPWNGLFSEGRNDYQMQYDTSLRDFTCRSVGTSFASDGSTCVASVDSEKIKTLLTPADSTPILFDPASKTYSYAAGGTPTPFKRVITTIFVSGEPTKRIKFNSKVFWNSQSGPREITMEDYAYDWR